jgi:hypothetical protein
MLTAVQNSADGTIVKTRRIYFTTFGEDAPFYITKCQTNNKNNTF